ncbi:Tripartite DNA replication factor [Orbilia brochopaga]|uniref:Tripartite DNA replication factor n=1 Tax=Orbilia brochopaga TaxID=3140254 RepID=A0AAV9V8V2_9PEZI
MSKPNDNHVTSESLASSIHHEATQASPQEEPREEATLLQDIETNAFEEKRILIPTSHIFSQIVFGGTNFEIPDIKGYGKVLRSGSLAYILEQKGLPTSRNPPIRLVFHHQTIKGHSVNVTDAMLSLSYDPKKLEVVYPPSAKESIYKTFFEAALHNERMELHIQKARPILLSLLDTFLGTFPQNARCPRKEASLKSPDYHIVAKTDYYVMQEENFLAEIAAKTRIAEQAFGGTLEKVIMDPEDDIGKLVIIHHSDDQKSAMRYHRVDEAQRFELWLPNESRLEAVWPRNTLEKGETFEDKDFKLLISSMDEAHRQIIRSWKPEGGGRFRLTAIDNQTEMMRYRKILRGAIWGLNSPNQDMLSSVIFSHYDPTIATEAEENIHAVIAASSLNDTQKRAAIHALSTPFSLPTRIAAFTGPAGTGKTYTLAVCIKAALHSSDYTKIIVSAKTNNNVERIFESVMSILDEDEKTKVLYLQGDIAASKTDQMVSPLSDLIKRYRLDYHLSKLLESEDSYKTNRQKIINSSQVIFATVDMVWRDLSDRSFPAELCILDEAAATSEIDSLILPTRFCNSIKRYIVCGDTMQLQPFSPANSPITRRSLLLHLQQEGWGIARLTDNYRMDPDLSQPLRSIFYNIDALAKLGMMKKEAERRDLLFDTESSKSLPGAAATLRCLYNFNNEILSKAAWIKIKGFEITRGYSFSNPKEIAVVVRVLEHILSFEPLMEQGICASRIGVLCMYQAQVHDMLETIETRHPEWLSAGLVVSTVDAYQGREKDIMLISLVRSNDDSIHGFLKKPHRLCCALSRARLGQIIVGDFDGIYQAVGWGDSKDVDSKDSDSKGTSKQEDEPITKSSSKYRGLARLLNCHQWNPCAAPETPEIDQGY